MKTILLGLSAAMLAGAVSSAIADSVKGEILAYDRKAGLIVLTDKTVWSLEGSTSEVPENLNAGTMVMIETTDGAEEGIGTVTAIEIVE